MVGEATIWSPRRVNFCLLGDIEAEERAFIKAEAAYDSAISLNPDFFYAHLRSGILTKNGVASPRQRRLNRSLQLLETSQAYAALGAIAEREGNLEEAQNLYAKAGAGAGAASQTALTSLVALRSQQEPQRLIDLRWGTGPDGTVLVKASNTTPRTLLGINLQIRLTDPLGSVNLYTQRLAASQLTGRYSLTLSCDRDRPSRCRCKHRVRHSLTRSFYGGITCADLCPAAPPPAGYLAAASGCLKIMISTPQVHQTKYHQRITQRLDTIFGGKNVTEYAHALGPQAHPDDVQQEQANCRGDRAHLHRHQLLHHGEGWCQIKSTKKRRNQVDQ